MGPTASDIARRPWMNQSCNCTPRAVTPHARATVTHDSATSTSACGSRLTTSGAAAPGALSAVAQSAAVAVLSLPPDSPQLLFAHLAAAALLLSVTAWPAEHACELGVAGAALLRWCAEGVTQVRAGVAVAV